MGYGISLGWGYSGFSRTPNQKDPATSSTTGKCAEAWNVGGKFEYEDLYFAVMYGQTLNMNHFGNNDMESIANKTQNLEVVASYSFDFGLTPSIGYNYSKGKNLGSFGDKELVNYIAIGSAYDFNKNLSAVIDYKINLLNDNDFTEYYKVNTDNVLGLGLVYQF